MYLRWHTEGTEVVVAPDLPSYVTKFPPTKLLFIAEPEIVDARAGAAGRALWRTAWRCCAHMNCFGELTSPGTSKGAALKFLAERLGIAREHVVAIGDQENDLAHDRLGWAGPGDGQRDPGRAQPPTR